MPQPMQTRRTDKISFRMPNADDGAAIWNLVRDCKPLDENSMYCNLIQCDHFRDTCVLAERDGEVVGWISAYLLPDDSETLFVWQVAVSPKARGTGLGVRMLEHLLEMERSGSPYERERKVVDEATRVKEDGLIPRHDGQVRHHDQCQPTSTIAARRSASASRQLEA